MMQAFSTHTGKTYPSWEDLIAAEANGYCVVVMIQTTSAKYGKTQNYSRVIGPFADKKNARNKAAAVRRAWKRNGERNTRAELLGVFVEPIWSELNFRVAD